MEWLREAFPPPHQFPPRLAVFLFVFRSLHLIATIVRDFSQSILRAKLCGPAHPYFVNEL